MKLFLILLRWQLRLLVLPNSIMLCCAILFTLLSSSAITFAQSPFAMLAILVHCAIMVLILGRSDTRGPGFLYAQGFSRDQLWWATFGATLASGLLVCGSGWLVAFTGLRSIAQTALGNPWFPMAGSIDARMVRWFLLEYLLLLPPLHYVWVRARQPQADAAAGWMLAIAAIAFDGFCLNYFGASDRGSNVLLVAISSTIAAMFFIGSWQFHRQIEVQS